MLPYEPLMENLNAQKAEDQDSQEQQIREGDERVQAEDSPQRISERPQSDEPRPSESHSGVGSGLTEKVAEQTDNVGAFEWQERQRQAQEFGQRHVLIIPRRVRVFLKDSYASLGADGKPLPGQYYDMAIVVPWLDWMSQMILWRGILFDHGWLPIEGIKAITPLNNEGQPDMTNVVPLRR